MATNERLHPQSMRELRGLIKLHGVQRIRRAIDDIEQSRRFAEAAERSRMPDGSISASRFIAECDAADREGVCVAVAFGRPHCVGKCLDPRDCSARPFQIMRDAKP